MRSSVQHPSIHRLVAASALALTVVLSGCGIGTSGSAAAGSRVAIHVNGVAHGGQQPVYGATVTMYAAGNSGLGSAATVLATTTTDANGNFYFGTSATDPIYCPSTISSGTPTATDTLYVVASGGQPLSSVTNANSVMMTVLGDCRNLENLQSNIIINELTTIASMTAMQHFYSPSSTPAAENFGTTANNTIGLANAAYSAFNLLNGGQVVSAPSGADASVTGATISITPESLKLYTMGDVLAACINSNPSSSTACSTLFGNVSPSVTPTDTLMAAYYMATVPAGVGTATTCNIGTSISTAPSICTLFGLVSGTSPFQQTYTSAPTDWTLGITYGTASVGTGTGTPALMSEPEYLAVDAAGDIWIANYTTTAAADSITELSPAGAPLKQALNGSFYKPTAMAIDPAGDVWVVNGGGVNLVEYTTGGTTNTYATGTGPYALAINGAGDVFVANKTVGNIQKVPAGTASGTAATTVATLAMTFPAMAFDTNYNLWVATGTTVDQFLYSNSYASATSAGTKGGLSAAETIAVDPSNNIWAANYNSTAGAGTLSELYATNTSTITAPSAAFTGAGLGKVKSSISDGAGNIWTTTQNSSTGYVAEYSNTGVALSPSTGTTFGFQHSSYYDTGIAIDPSGNVWYGTEETTSGGFLAYITEIVGAAVPVITPLSANLPATASATSKTTLPLTLPNAFATYNTAATYSPTVGTIATSATGTFSLVYNGTTLCSAAGPFASGGTITCNIAATTTLPLVNGVSTPYTVAAVYSGDATYASSSTPTTIIIEPAAGSGGFTSTAALTGTAQSGAGSSALPIVGGTATLWATANNGVPTTQASVNSGEIDGSFYLGAAVPLATATTTSTGGFTFSSFACASPDQLYITVNGGQVGGNAANGNIVLLAALGTCNSTTASLTPIVNEVTTVAAAYALAPFISIVKATPAPSTTNPNPTTYYNVNITASATNYATYAQTTGTIYHPVGLQHAFLNAANLANVSGTGAGTANATLTGYSGTAVPIMPNYLLNSVANVLATCVQAAGACSNIFAAALPLTTGTATAPTNTLAAALNVARNPYMGGAGKAATWLGLGTITSSTGAYTPVVTPASAGTTTATPHDLSAAIVYPKGLTSTANGALSNSYGVTATMDANDNFYLVSWSITSSPYSYGINAFNSAGQNIMHHLFSQACTAYSTTCNEYTPSGNVTRLAADNNGNLWLATTGSTGTSTSGTYVSTQSMLIQLTASTGAFAYETNTNVPQATATQESSYIAPGYTFSLAVDQSNNVYVGTETVSGAIYQFPYNSSTNTLGTGTSIGTTGVGTGAANDVYAYSMLFDDQENLWSVGYHYTSPTYSQGVAVVPNLSLTSPAYPGSTGGAVASSFTPTTTNPKVQTLGTYNYGIAVDAAGNIYSGTNTSTTPGAAGTGINLIGRTYTGNTITGLTAGSSLLQGAAISTTNGLLNVQFSEAQLLGQDGAGAIYVPDYTADTIVRMYGTAPSSVLAFYPCVAATCSTVYTSGTNMFAAKQPFVDSTGTLTVFTTTNGNYVQVFGIATPAFPLAQSGHPAQMP